MKRLFEILLIIASVLISAVGLAFAFIEARLLFSGDWLLYNTAAVGFIQYLLRFLISLGAVAFGIMTVIFRNDLVSKIYFIAPMVFIAAFAMDYAVSPFDIVIGGLIMFYYLSLGVTVTLRNKLSSGA